MNAKILFLITVLVIAPVLAAAHPIITRHDREDAAYRDLGAKYAGALCEVRVEDAQGVRAALGTLIAPRWVLTAAHVAQGMKPGHAIRFDGQDYPVARVTLQPQWQDQEHDLALIYLQTPVEAAQPLPLYRWDDEAGQQIIFVGSGMSGNGQTGPTAEDGVLRGATNRVNEVGPEWLNFIFDAPDTPGVTNLEGISGPGDSGGPGILVREGSAYLAGVSSGQDAAPTGGKEGRYGVIEYYTRISHYIGWVERTMEAVAKHDIVQGDLGETLDAYLSEQVSDGFSGSVLVATADGIVLEKGYGLADRVRNIPNAGTTVFPLGSIVKTFTREAIQQLATEGQLALDDPLCTFFDDVPADKQGITIQQLLDHQSGLAAYHDEEGDFESMDRAEALRRIFAQELRFAPGTSQAYSNSGYTLLAAIIETVAGQSYSDFVKEKLVQPAGLAHTGFYRDPRWVDGNVAIGYEAQTFGAVNSPQYWPGPTWALMGSGGMGSTVHDLYTWMGTMLRQHGFSPQSDAGSANKAGQELLDEAVAFVAGGGDHGHYAVSVVLPDGTTLVVMNNASKDGVEDLHILASLASLRYGGDAVQPPRPEMFSAADLAETPAGQKMLAMVEAISAGTEAAARAFLEEHMDAGFKAEGDAVLKDFAQLYATLGDDPVMDLVVQPSPYRVETYLQNPATSEWRKIGLTVERDAPHLMAGLSISPEAPPAANVAKTDCAEFDFELPDSPTGRTAEALLRVICETDVEARRQFIKTQLNPTFRDQFPIEQHLEIFQMLHDDFGTPDLLGVEETGATGIRLIMRSSSHERMVIVLEMDPAPPHKIVGLGVEPAGAEDPGEAEDQGDGSSDGMASGPSLSDEELVAALSAYLQKLTDEDAFSGAVLLAKDGEVLFEQAYGLADQEHGIPNRIDTRFNMGSMNKMFTALAIAQLAEQGKLSFDDPIQKHLPDYPNREVAEKVTIHHLLTHMSGLGFYPFEHGKRTPADLIPLFADAPLAFEPGSDVQYSNAGFAVLGVIIERASGEDYYDYVQRHIFAPAGMTGSGSFANDEAVPNRAIAYTRDGDGPRRPATDLLEIKGSPAGGGYATVRDMWRFGEALRNHTLLGPKFTEVLLTGKVDMGPGLRYAYGFGDQRQNGHRSVGHNGGAPGVGADFKVYLNDGYTSVLFSNYGARIMMDIAKQLDAWVTDQELATEDLRAERR